MANQQGPQGPSNNRETQLSVGSQRLLSLNVMRDHYFEAVRGVPVAQKVVCAEAGAHLLIRT